MTEKFHSDAINRQMQLTTSNDGKNNTGKEENDAVRPYLVVIFPNFARKGGTESADRTKANDNRGRIIADYGQTHTRCRQTICDLVQTKS